jgi:hypothetical protein
MICCAWLSDEPPAALALAGVLDLSLDEPQAA